MLDTGKYSTERDFRNLEEKKIKRKQHSCVKSHNVLAKTFVIFVESTSISLPKSGVNILDEACLILAT